MKDLFNYLLFFFTSRWGIFLVFVVWILLGIIVEVKEKRKGKETPEKTDLDTIIVSFSGMNSKPWAKTDDESKPKSKIEKFYTGTNPKLANMKSIIYDEEKIMKERAKEVAARDAEDNQKHD